MNRLAPLSEEPIDEENVYSKKQKKWRNWITKHFPIQTNKKSDMKLLLSVLGCPLFPMAIHPRQHIDQVISSSAQYIIQHFTAATGCRNVDDVSLTNMYATGKVSMGVVDEVCSNGGATVSSHEKGCFVIWQMLPNKWLIELVVGGHKVVAGSDGDVAWRQTPWLGAHAAKGCVKPLRRILQGLDPVAISLVFSTSQYIGEKQVCGDVDCFVLKLSADNSDLIERSDTTSEMIKHVTLGYFSQRSGFLVYLEDSYLNRIQSPGSQPTYWETTMCTKIEDYRAVDGIMMAHSGQSSVVITRFGDNLRSGPCVTTMEETYVIDDIAFNVHGLTNESFIIPQEMKTQYPQQNLQCRSPLHP